MGFGARFIFCLQAYASAFPERCPNDSFRRSSRGLSHGERGGRWLQWSALEQRNVPHCSVRDIKVAAPIESNAHTNTITHRILISQHCIANRIDGVGRAQRRRYISRAAWSPPLRKTTPVVVRQAHDNAVACCPPLQGRVWSKRRTKAAGALSFQNRISPLVWLGIAFRRWCGWVSTRMSKSRGLNRSRFSLLQRNGRGPTSSSGS